MNGQHDARELFATDVDDPLGDELRQLLIGRADLNCEYPLTLTSSANSFGPVSDCSPLH